jgi:hypothetical protein
MRAIAGVAALDGGSVQRNGAPIDQQGRHRIMVLPTVAMALLASTIYERAIRRTGTGLKVRQVLGSAT